MTLQTIAVLCTWVLFKGIPASAQTNLPLTPVFVNAQQQTKGVLAAPDRTEYQYTFTNTTRKSINLYNAYRLATVTLDGKEYPRSVVAWAGNDSLGPGLHWTNTLRLRDFIYGGSLPAFPWKNSPLTPGVHTLTYKMGGKTYGPVTFICQSTAPAYGFVPPLTPQMLTTLVPVFWNTPDLDKWPMLNSPAFAYAYTNTTDSTVDILKIYARSTLSLDGKEYGRNFILWRTSSNLRPAQNYSNTDPLSSYLPKEPPLADGPHSLSFTIGGKTHGPIAFIWRTHP